jgi:multiple sugar transport system substrate-binding protein
MKKRFAFAAGLTAAALALGAFAPSAQAADKIQVRLLGWAGSEVENKALELVISNFNASQDEIEARFEPVPDYDTVLQNALVGGDVPDVFYVPAQRFPDLVASEALMPIGDKIENADDFYPALNNTFTSGGTLYCPPKDFSVLALQINTDMFEKAGLQPPTTWAELEAAAKALTTDTVAGIVLNPTFDRFGAFLYAGGAEVTDAEFKEMKINSPEAMAALDFYSGLYINGFAKTSTDLGAGWAGEAFGKGLAAMAMEGNWVVGFLKDNFPDLKYQTVEIPMGPTDTKGTLAFTVCYGVGMQSPNPEASIKFINYLVGPEGMKTWTGETGILPSRISMAEEFIKAYPDREVYLKSAEFARGWSFVPGWKTVEDKANEQIQLLFAGQALTEDVLKEIEATGKSVLEKVNSN